MHCACQFSLFSRINQSRSIHSLYWNSIRNLYMLFLALVYLFTYLYISMQRQYILNLHIHLLIHTLISQQMLIQYVNWMFFKCSQALRHRLIRNILVKFRFFFFFYVSVLVIHIFRLKNFHRFFHPCFWSTQFYCCCVEILRITWRNINNA